MFTKNCPKCDFIVAADAAECARCGVIFDRVREHPGRADPGPRADALGPRGGGADLGALLAPTELYIDQHALHWWEILFNWEQRNEYQVCDPRGASVGNIVEQGTGFFNALLRVFLGSHRPLDVTVFNARTELVLRFTRTFFWFFSSLTVKDALGATLGRVERRFGFINKTYDLYDATGQKFAQIRSPIWKLWTFPVYVNDTQEVAGIRKRWNGLAKEWFTDADRFQVDFGAHPWSPSQRAVVFAAALSIDFDFFENNNQR